MKSFIRVFVHKSTYNLFTRLRNLWCGTNKALLNNMNIARTRELEIAVEQRTMALITANEELAYQNNEKGKRAAELVIANIELAFQSGEKEKRAAELLVANTELVFQNEEKKRQATELMMANNELVFQNEEKGKHAAELIIANTELAIQNSEKEKRAAALAIINTELEAFSYISSHDLQEPLRKIQVFSKRIMETESNNLSTTGVDYFKRIQSAAIRMQQLIDDLLAFSQLNITERKFECTDLGIIINEIMAEFKETIEEAHAVIEAEDLCKVNVIPFQFRQLMQNLISNALKFSKPGQAPYIVIKSRIEKGFALNETMLVPEKDYCHISITDNGIGFDAAYKGRIFEVFQRLHTRSEYEGTGIGLSIVKKVMDNHHGAISTTSAVDRGATFNLYLPAA